MLPGRTYVPGDGLHGLVAVMTADRDPTAQSPQLLEAFSEKTYRTYLARLRASKRLAARNRAWNTSLIATAAASTISSIALLSDDTIYGKTGPTLLVSIAVLMLVISLVTSGIDYSGRSRDMFLNYRRIQSISTEAERASKTPHLQTEELLDDLMRRYDGLLDESENHTSVDFARALSERNLPAPGTPPSTWTLRGETAISSLPYLSLLIPIGLLVPVIIWIASGA